MNDSGLDDTVGMLLAGRYLIEDVIGRGGMSTVYRATDQSLGRTVAIKLFRTDLADSGDSRRQQAEIRLLAALSHPALVTLFDAVSEHGDHRGAFLVMEFVEGTDLHGVLSNGPIDPAMVATMLGDVADALSHVHDSDVIHRDIKPSNILVPPVTSTGPRARLADFGIARLIDAGTLTAVGSVLGTANYLSPEQALGRTLSPASDVYSLGLVTIEALTGTKSFPGPGIESVAARLNRDPEVPTGFGPDWHDLLVRMTQRDPAERPSAHNVAVALRGLAIAPAPDRADTVAFTLDLPTERVEVVETTHRVAVSDEPTQLDAAGADVPTQLVTTSDTTERVSVADQRTRRVDVADVPTELVATPALAEPTVATPTVAAATLADPDVALDRTLVMPMAAAQREAAAPTELLSAPEPAVASAAPRTRPARRPFPRRLATVAAILVVIGVTLAVILPRFISSASAPAESSIEYPAVDGDLGTHLEQLQDSVAP
jgi:tRNA A-37 threonylcarbamoyl transferase component Bud32